MLFKKKVLCLHSDLASTYLSIPMKAEQPGGIFWGGGWVGCLFVCLLAFINFIMKNKTCENEKSAYFCKYEMKRVHILQIFHSGKTGCPYFKSA